MLLQNEMLVAPSHTVVQCTNPLGCRIIVQCCSMACSALHLAASASGNLD